MDWIRNKSLARRIRKRRIRIEEKELDMRGLGYKKFVVLKE